jgi:AcrR family transcriptional regulator
VAERGRATRGKLIEATLAVVREAGYARATTRAIARAAGVAEGTIYRHFPDKSSLFFAAVLESNAPLVEWMAALPGRAGSHTVEANLRDALVRLAGLRDQIVPLELAIAVDPELAAQRDRILAASGGRLPPGPPEAIARYLAEEQRLGRVRAGVDPTEAAILILALLFGLGAGRTPSGATLDEHLASAARLFVQGIQAPAPDS